jgi:hypothetical protein
MIRAQTTASSLSAALEVLSRFVTAAMQPAARSPFEQEIFRAASLIKAELATVVVQPEAAPAHRIEEGPRTAPVEEIPIAAEMPPAAEVPPAAEPVILTEPVPVFAHEPSPEVEPVVAVPALPQDEPAGAEQIFSLDSLPPEEQELHRRAYRVAKVSMQDIKMLRPDDVQLGREKRDLCFRLRDDIEKAHKEYDRRFQSINSHPVDYFYDWMVEILAGGDPHALGEYPYPSPVLRR